MWIDERCMMKEVDENENEPKVHHDQVQREAEARNRVSPTQQPTARYNGTRRSSSFELCAPAYRMVRLMDEPTLSSSVTVPTMVRDRSVSSSSRTPSADMTAGCDATTAAAAD